MGEIRNDGHTLHKCKKQEVREEQVEVVKDMTDAEKTINETSIIEQINLLHAKIDKLQRDIEELKKLVMSGATSRIY